MLPEHVLPLQNHSVTGFQQPVSKKEERREGRKRKRERDNDKPRTNLMKSLLFPFFNCFLPNFAIPVTFVKNVIIH